MFNISNNTEKKQTSLVDLQYNNKNEEIRNLLPTNKEIINKIFQERKENTFLQTKSINASSCIRKTSQKLEGIAGKAIKQDVKKSESQVENKRSLKRPFNVEDAGPLAKEFGNKHARLIEQAAIFLQMEMPGVQVPMPHGLSNSLIQTFLKKHAPDLETIWRALNKNFKESVKNDKFYESDFLKNSKVQEFLKSIRESITSAFENERAQGDLPLSEEMLGWLKEIERKSGYLMSRSTGAEDSRQAANAGGNLSVAYVEPNVRELFKACGQVIASYFSEGSLQNRINANENPFDSPLCLAVTHQELIGERVGGEAKAEGIPISLVLFSNEPNYVGNEKFRIMRISATRGHGEGVVGMAGIRSDTYLILQSAKHPERLYVLEDNQFKPCRLAPIRDPITGSVALGKLANSADIAETSSLDGELLERLFNVGLIVENAYGNQPMDMELVIKNGVIYPVQARPINRPAPHPTYLDWKKAGKIPPQYVREKIQLEPFLPGLAEAQVIRSANEILIAENLENAEKLFKKSLHKLVVIREEEPANSHPVVNFSGMGIPVMYNEKNEAIQALAEQITEKMPLIACVQTGHLLLLDSTIAEPEACISEGYTVHPARVAISVHDQRLPPGCTEPMKVPQEVKSLLAKARALESNEAALEAIRKLQKHEIFENISKKQKILAERISLLPDLSENHRARGILRGIERFQIVKKRAFSELKAALKSTPEARLLPLFHMKAVEALIQQREAPQALGRLSVINLESQLDTVEKMLAYREEMGFAVLFSEEVLFTAAAMTPVQEQKWVHFLKDIEVAYRNGKISKAETDHFKDMMATLQKINLLPLWMMRFFQPHAAKNKNSLDLMRKLTSEFTEEAKASLENLHTVAEEIQAASENLDSFGDPQSFEKAWKNLQAICKKLTFTDPAAKSHLSEASSLERISTYQVMGQFVDFFDSAIKRMKGSTSFEEGTKISHFHNMLIDYFELLEDWSENLAGPFLRYHPDYSLDTYLNRLGNAFRKTKKSSDELRPSNGFSVAAGVLGTETDLSRSLPKTKEDVFTMIHQNLLACLQALVGEEMKNKVSLPPPVKQAIEQVGDLPVQLVGYSFPKNQTILHYNYPLRSHSATFQVQFDKKKQAAILEVSFLGFARERWEAMRSSLQYLHNQGFLTLVKDPSVNPTQLTYQLKLKPDEMSLEFELLYVFAEFSMHSNIENLVETLTVLIRTWGRVDKFKFNDTKSSLKASLLKLKGNFLLDLPEWQNDKKSVLLAVKQNGRALDFAHPDMQNDKDVVLEAIRQDYAAFQFAHPDLKKDPEFIQSAIKISNQVLVYASEAIRGNKEIVLEALEKMPLIIDYIHPDLFKDKEVILAAVKLWGTALVCASEDLRKDKEVVLAAVKSNGIALEYAHEDLRKDEEVVLAAVQSKGSALEFAYLDMQKNEAIVLAAVETDGNAIRHAHPELQKNEKIALAAINNCPSAFLNLDPELKQKEEIILAAVSKLGILLNILEQKFKTDKKIVLAGVAFDGSCLEYAGSFRNDKEVVLTAIKQDDYAFAFKHAHEDLKKDKEFVLKAIKEAPKGGRILEYIHSDLQNDKEVVLAAVKSYGEAVEFASLDLKKDEEVALAVEQNPDAFQYLHESVKSKIKRKRVR